MRRLRLVLGFFTVLPLSQTGGLGEIAAAGFLLPLVALLLGGAEGLAGWGLAHIFGPPVTAALVLVLALLLTGLHHTDGLADVGDAIMAGGGHERRLAVLKDRAMGTGAVTALILVYLASWAALLELLPAGEASRLPWLLMAVEVAARLSLVVTAALSRPSHSGSGSAFVVGMKGGRGAVAIFLSAVFLAALTVPLGWRIPLAGGISSVAVGLLLVQGGRRWFGGANGDLLGAAVELGRMAALLGAVAAICH
ncbi:MAG: adenosylcobinamide-GDP ribazoletransferase [Thermoleophilia bacterium]